MLVANRMKIYGYIDRLDILIRCSYDWSKIYIAYQGIFRIALSVSSYLSLSLSVSLSLSLTLSCFRSIDMIARANSN